MVLSEVNAKPSLEMAPARRQFESLDACCGHLPVDERNEGTGAEAVVSGDRLLRRETARHLGID